MLHSLLSRENGASIKPRAVHPKLPLFITEGVKKGDSLVSHGVCAIALLGVWNFRGTNQHGGKTALPDWEYVALNDRIVYIVYDSDAMQKPSVHQALVRIKGFLEQRRAAVQVVYLPPTADGAKQGADDYLAAGHTIDELLTLATTQLLPPDEQNRKPKVRVNARFMRDITSDAVSVLEANNDPPRLFRSGTTLVRTRDRKVEILERTHLKGLLDRTADFVKENKDGETAPARPPSDVVDDILTLPDLPFPNLEGIRNTPVFMPNGELLAVDGYHPGSGLLLDLADLGRIETLPLSEARGHVLEELLTDFPFVDEASKAHAVALLLQPFVRPMIEGPTPLFGVDAPTRGTGKGLLVDAVARVVTGGPAPIMAQPRDSDEIEKRVTAKLLAGSSMIVLDNVTALRASSLAAALTSELWEGRRLGKSEIVRLKNNATWASTGNNVELSEEIARRYIQIRLDAGVAHPELRRDFRHPDLRVWVTDNRALLVSACISVIQAWIDAGRPPGSPSLGSYESWAAIMGGILEVADIPGFLAGRERLLEDRDREAVEWTAVCEAWYRRFGTAPITPGNLFDVLKEGLLLLDIWSGRNPIGAQQRVGHALAKAKDRVFGPYRVRASGRDSFTGNAAYRLEDRGAETTETPETPPDIELVAGLSGVSGVFDQTDTRVVEVSPTPEEDADPNSSLIGSTEGDL